MYTTTGSACAGRYASFERFFRMMILDGYLVFHRGDQLAHQLREAAISDDGDLLSDRFDGSAVRGVTLEDSLLDESL